MENIKQIDDYLDSAQLICTTSDGKTKYDCNKFTFLLNLLQKSIVVVLKILINKLNNNYNPKNKTKIKEKDDALKSAKKLLFIREKIINAFKKGIFPYIDRFQVEKETEDETDAETNEEMDTTITSELESEESAVERRNQ